MQSVTLLHTFFVTSLPRLSPALYSLAMQNRGLKHQSLHFCCVIVLQLYASFRGEMTYNLREVVGERTLVPAGCWMESANLMLLIIDSLDLCRGKVREREKERGMGVYGGVVVDEVDD